MFLNTPVFLNVSDVQAILEDCRPNTRTHKGQNEIVFRLLPQYGHVIHF